MKYIFFPLIIVRQIYGCGFVCSGRTVAAMLVAHHYAYWGKMSRESAGDCYKAESPEACTALPFHLLPCWEFANP